MGDVVVRAPGRVNLIGEHTDYMHLPVLPMAIQRGITIVASSAPSPGVAATSSMAPGRIEVVPGRPPTDGWGRYVHGAVHQLETAAGRRGAELRIVGDLPDTGGLSSSSALTVGVMKALVLLWELDLDDEEVVRRSIAAERVVGVESGGMDQTVIMFAESGAALRIDWQPPRRSVVPIPPTLRFVIGYSGRSAPKGGVARDFYNERVVSCRAAALILERATGIPAGSPPRLAPFVDLDLAGFALPTGTTASMVAKEVDVDVDELVRLTAGRFHAERALDVAAAADHVITEARRVDHFEAAIAAAEFGELGRLLDESHASLRSFGVSTEELDATVGSARAAGALGARLTGAGFGGWAVAACTPERVEDVKAAMRRAGGGQAFEVTPARGIH